MRTTPRQIAAMYGEDLAPIEKAIRVAKEVLDDRLLEGEAIGLTELGEILAGDEGLEFEDEELYFEISYYVLDQAGLLVD